MRPKGRHALDQAAHVIFLIDGRTEITGADRDLAQLLRQLGKPVSLAVNKIDVAKREDLIGDFYSLGINEVFPVSAVAYREGHHALGVNVVWRGPDGEAEPFTRLEPGEPGLDRWHGVIRPDRVGRWTFTIEAFDDPYRTWRDAVVKKIAAGQGLEDLANDLAEGAEVLDLAAKIVPHDQEERVRATVAARSTCSRPTS